VQPKNQNSQTALQQELSLELKEIEVFVFDLDGTLYEDTGHFDYYADCLAEELDDRSKEKFFKDLKASRRGEHVLQLGRVYDREKDLILEITPAGEVKKAWNWQGEALSSSVLAEHYPEPVNCNMHDMIYLGDGWWPPAACAYHYGAVSTERCYQQTKDWLAENDDFLTPLPGLESTLSQLAEVRELILATNSEAQDTDRLLDLLNLQGIFTERYTSCNKPADSRQLFQKIIAKYEISPEEMLSIGDNYLNDIAPARELGCQTVLLDPREVFADRENTGPVVSSILELLPDFQTLIL